MRRNNINAPRVNRSLLLPVFAALILQSGMAHANESSADDQQASEAESGAYVPGEIIVTAQRRSESLQKVPVAMTALTSETLVNQGVTNLNSLAAAAPSLKVTAYPNASDTLTLTMRGQGAGDVGQITRDGGVGLYMDGFYIGRPQGALLDLGDPERIEVLRGPQGTLYGRNTTGGAVNIITKKPSGELGGNVTLATGSRNLVRALGTIDLPEFANISVKGSLTYVDKDGWVKNGDSDRNYNDFNQFAGRLAVKWAPTDNFTANYGFNLGRVRTTPNYYINNDLVLDGYVADKDRTYTTLDLDYSVSKFVDHQLTLEWDISDKFQIRSLSAYRGFRATQDVNYGAVYSTAGLVPAGNEFNLTVEQDHYYRTSQYSQELQLVGDINDRLTFTGGLYFYREKGRHKADNYSVYLTYGGMEAFAGRDVNTLSKSYAAYAQSTWTPGVLDDRLKLTVGARYTKDKRSADRVTYDTDPEVLNPREFNNQSFDNFSPMANLAVEWTSNLMTYAKYSQSYKAGGSAESTLNFANTFGPEKVKAWEAGFKSQLFDRRLTLNLAAFYNDFNDLQVDYLETNDQTIIATSNAGRASIKGVELDATLRLSNDFSFYGSFSYMDQNVKQVDVIPGSVFDQVLNPGDNAAPYLYLPFVPKYSYNFGGDWTFLRTADDAEFSLHANYGYQGKVSGSVAAGRAVVGRDFYFSDPSKLLNARISFKRPTASGAEFKLSVFADNLLDHRGTTYSAAIGGTLATGFTGAAKTYQEPRTIGVEARLGF